MNLRIQGHVIRVITLYADGGAGAEVVKGNILGGAVIPNLLLTGDGSKVVGRSAVGVQITNKEIFDVGDRCRRQRTGRVSTFNREVKGVGSSTTVDHVRAGQCGLNSSCSRGVDVGIDRVVARRANDVVHTRRERERLPRSRSALPNHGRHGGGQGIQRGGQGGLIAGGGGHDAVRAS